MKGRVIAKPLSQQPSNVLQRLLRALSHLPVAAPANVQQHKTCTDERPPSILPLQPQMGRCGGEGLLLRRRRRSKNPHNVGVSFWVQMGSGARPFHAKLRSASAPNKTSTEELWP
jgi:hypothetical protein